MKINSKKSFKIFFWMLVTLVIVLNLGGALIFDSEMPPMPDLEVETPEVREAKTVAFQDLDIPWEILFLPDGEILVSERDGDLIMLEPETKNISTISGVAHTGEGGLLGMALHPEFESNRYVYLYLTSRSGGGLINRVERYKFENQALTDREVIIDNIPGAIYHDGGRIAFGPDDLLYITTGDATNEPLAQDTSSLAGKILRIGADGSIPPDNPFGNAVYSYGHRNPQGIAWDDQGRLWATEHGRSGVRSGYDELNLIEKGGNYGWPEIEGDEEREGMKKPVLHSGPNETWAPSGLAFYDGSLFFAGLRGESLYEFDLGDFSFVGHFRGEFGRLRAVRVSPDDYLYFSTSNRDGRGRVNEGDDKIIKVDPNVL